MGIRNPFDLIERKVGGALEGAGDAMFKGSLSTVKIARAAEKAMREKKIVGVGRVNAPTLYDVNVSAEDDQQLKSFYPSMMAEVENDLITKAQEESFTFAAKPLVRFYVDESLKRGKFYVVAECVSPTELEAIRQEEYEFLGIAQHQAAASPAASVAPAPVMHAPIPAAPVAPVAPVASAAGAEASAGRPWDRFGANGAGVYGAGTGAGVYGADTGAGGYDAYGASGTNNAQAGGANPPAIGETLYFANKGQNDAFGDAYDNVDKYGYLVDLETNTAYPLAEITNVGRDVYAHVPIANKSVSRRHACIECYNERVVVRDLGSSNGTYLNNRAITSAAIEPGDMITFGNARFEYRRDRS